MKNTMKLFLGTATYFDYDDNSNDHVHQRLIEAETKEEAMEILTDNFPKHYDKEIFDTLKNLMR